MHPSSRQHWELHAIIALLLTALAGCGGVDIVALQQSQIGELQFENARQKDSILEGLGHAARLDEDLKASQMERIALHAQVESLGTNLRHANNEVQRLGKENEDLAKRVADSSATVERLEASLDKVKQVAGSSAGELADLRLKSRESEGRIAQLTKETTALQERNGNLLAEIDKLSEELVRNRAVVRALQGEESSKGSAVKAGLDEIARLKDANSELKRETDALKERLASLGDAPISTGARVAAAPAAAAPVESARSLEKTLSDLGGLLSERYRRAASGQIAWDSVDLLIVGALAVVGLLAAWGTIRWLRVRKVGKQLRLLNARVLELEHMQAEGGPGSLLEVSAGPRATARREAAAPKFRRSPAMRRSGFSAVISSKDISARSAPAPVDAVDQVLEPVLASGGASPDEEPEPARVQRTPSGVRSAPAPAVAHETRKVIGARLWQESARPQAPLEDDLVSTQIIPKVSDVTEIVHQPFPMETVEPSPRSFRREEPAAPDSGGARPSVGTPPSNVPPSSASASSGSPSGASPSSPASDQDLLAELKAVVNKKFDELVT